MTGPLKFKRRKALVQRLPYVGTDFAQSGIYGHSLWDVPLTGDYWGGWENWAGDIADSPETREERARKSCRSPR